MLVFNEYLIPKYSIAYYSALLYCTTGIRATPNHSFPFQDLENDEFLKTIGSWVYNSEDRLSEKVDLYRDIVVSPDENDPIKCANDNYIESQYYS